MVTGTRSNVTPVGLRESTRPPVYRDKYSEGASGTLYTTYTEYKKRVAHGDAGGAIQREVVSVAELIPSHVQKCFARVYPESRTITPTQLVVAVESHAGHGEGAEVDLSAASSAVAKAVAMDTRRKTLLEREGPILSNLEEVLANNPNLETVYRGSDGKCHPGPADIIAKALVEGLAPETFYQGVKVNLQHAGNWKAGPDLVMDTVVVEKMEWRKVEAFSQSSTSTPPSRQHGSKSAGPSAK